MREEDHQRPWSWELECGWNFFLMNHSHSFMGKVSLHSVMERIQALESPLWQSTEELWWPRRFTSLNLSCFSVEASSSSLPKLWKLKAPAGQSRYLFSPFLPLRGDEVIRFTEYPRLWDYAKKLDFQRKHNTIKTSFKQLPKLDNRYMISFPLVYFFLYE